MADVFESPTIGKSVGKPRRKCAAKAERRSEKHLRFDDEQKLWTMRVARDGKLEVSATTRSYSCAPPGGPVRHIIERDLEQTNLPDDEHQAR
jgi:hypothetical protein